MMVAVFVPIIAGMLLSAPITRVRWTTSYSRPPGDLGFSAKDDLDGEICRANQAAGFIALADAFPIGDRHPPCRCALSSMVVDGVAAKIAKAYDPNQPRDGKERSGGAGLGFVDAAAPAVKVINRVLGAAMPGGGANVPAKVHSKLKYKRPDDYNFVMAHLNAALLKPDYVGLDTHHQGNVNLVKETADGRCLLVSIKGERDARGRYTVITAYPFERIKIQKRLANGTLKTTKKRL